MGIISKKFLVKWLDRKLLRLKKEKCMLEDQIQKTEDLLNKSFDNLDDLDRYTMAVELGYVIDEDLKKK